MSNSRYSEQASNTDQFDATQEGKAAPKRLVPEASPNPDPDTFGHSVAPVGAPASFDAEQAGSAPVPYERPRAPHRSLDPINDLEQEEDLLADLPHDSHFEQRSGMLDGRAYRRSRDEIDKLRQNLHYGQYLEIPKGRREIFVSREKRRRVKSIISLFICIVIIVVICWFVWWYMQSHWGSTL